MANITVGTQQYTWPLAIFVLSALRLFCKEAHDRTAPVLLRAGATIFRQPIETVTDKVLNDWRSKLRVRNAVRELSDKLAHSVKLPGDNRRDESSRPLLSPGANFPAAILEMAA